MSRRLAIVAALALVVGATAATPTSLAVFTSSRASTATFGTATIAPPTALSGTGGATATASSRGYAAKKSAILSGKWR